MKNTAIGQNLPIWGLATTIANLGNLADDYQFFETSPISD